MPIVVFCYTESTLKQVDAQETSHTAEFNAEGNDGSVTKKFKLMNCNETINLLLVDGKNFLNGSFIIFYAMFTLTMFFCFLL